MKNRLDKWLKKIGMMGFPILQLSKDRLADMDSLTNEIVTDVLENDVGLAINIIHQVNTKARGHLNHRLTTLEYASVMLGMGNVRDIALDSQTVEELPDNIKTHILQAYGHALHSAMISREIAVMRNDLVADELYLAGFLHSIGNLVMWLLAPGGMHTVRVLLRSDCRTSDEVEYLVFGFTQSNLSYALAKKWNMPAAVMEAMRSGAASQTRLCGVVMAEYLSHVVVSGHGSHIVSGSLEDIAGFLGYSTKDVMARLVAVHDNCIKIARQYGELFNHEAEPWTGALEIFEREELSGEGEEETTPVDLSDDQVICIAPHMNMMGDLDCYLDSDSEITLEELLEETVHLLHDAVGLNRVMYASVFSDTDCLKARYTAGADRDISFNLLSVDLSSDSIFKQLLAQNSLIWMTSAMWERMSKMIPDGLSKMNQTKSFFSQALYIRGKPHGVFYADRRITQCQLDHLAFQRFQELVGKCQLLMNQLIA